jgi:hypothetical protein
MAKVLPKLESLEKINFSKPAHHEKENITDAIKLERSSEKKVITSKERIVWNAKGVKFEVLLEALAYVPNSRLSDLKELLHKNLEHEESKQILDQICDAYSDDMTEFYFNKDPNIVTLILKFYEQDMEDQKTHVNLQNVCLLELDAAFSFWRIDYAKYLDACCLRKFEEDKESEIEMIETEKKIITEFNLREDFGVKFYPHIREKIWYIMEVPNSSFWSRIYILFSACMTLFSSLDIIFR